MVGKELVRLLQDPSVIQEELNRGLEATRKTDPLKQREELLEREQARLAKNMDRLLNAYQEGLVSLEQLRGRMPELRKQQQAAQGERQSPRTGGSLPRDSEDPRSRQYGFGVKTNRVGLG